VSEWRPIPGYPGYEASDCGQVRSFRRLKGRAFKKHLSGRGYYTVSITDETGSGDNARHLRYRFADVLEMRRLRNDGWTLRQIAGKFGMSKGYVSELVRGVHRAVA
jgi:AraC-like DNA-binding protein